MIGSYGSFDPFAKSSGNDRYSGPEKNASPIKAKEKALIFSPDSLGYPLDRCRRSRFSAAERADYGSGGAK
jgi:hypothetical protein